MLLKLQIRFSRKEILSVRKKVHVAAGKSRKRRLLTTVPFVLNPRDFSVRLSSDPKRIGSVTVESINVLSIKG
jgi:hypothetical protein